jgi:iron complex outermembrane receptor protein
MTNTNRYIFSIILMISLLFIHSSLIAEDLPEITIEDKLFEDTTVISPTTVVTEEQLEKINFATTEDAIALEPSLVVRRRFIGDANGVIGIRGSNMFQGHRSMVFSNGIPLHYHLQTRWSGAPRWSLVSPGEIEEIEVIYGPFSAEYSGNSMGGVVNIKTKSPTERKFTLEGNLFVQDYDEYGTDESFNGSRGFFSYEDKIEDLTIFASYNRLDNNSHPQSFYSSTGTVANTGTSVGGIISGQDSSESDVFYYGDSGTENARSDLLSVKLGYDFGDYELRTSMAYEQRDHRQKNLNNYVTDVNGDTVWNGTVNFNGQDISLRSSNFQERYQDRNSLLFGVGLSGPVGQTDWIFDLHYSDFEILKDDEIRTGRNPSDPDYVATNEALGARITEADDTGWETFDIKLGTDYLLGNENARLSIGFHYDEYELSVKPYNYDAINNIKGDSRGASGGETSTKAVFAQFGYAFTDQYDLALGVRYEDWESKGGFSDDGEVVVANRDEQEISPKLSLGYFPTSDVAVRYSVARAVRFPIVEELYRNETAENFEFISDPDLEPEDGIHHNLSIEKMLNAGQVKLNIFHETVDDVIFTFSGDLAGGGSQSTTLPVDEVETTGVEFIYNQDNFLSSPFDIRFNVAYTDAEITKNTLNPDIEGKDFPRIPKWRSNLLVSYDYNDNVNFNTSVRYASNTYGELDNSDTADNVYGSHDDYLFVNVKTNLKVAEDLRLGAGIDNLFNKEAYVHHPWPKRTFYLEGKYTF